MECRIIATGNVFHRHGLVFGIACGLALLLFVLAVLPALADGEISVTASKYENTFPKQIKFTIQAQSASPITQVRLRYRIGYSQATGNADATFTQGNDVSGQYVWDFQRQYIPPGIDLQYYWQIRDAAGHQLQTPPATLVVEDTRFDWQSLTSGLLTLYWYKGDRAFGQALLTSGTRALQQIGDDVGANLDHPVKIFIYATQPDLMGALPPRGVEWTGGQAFPEAGIVVLTAAPTSAGRDYGLRTVAHELSHLITHAATENPYGGLPQWLDEGLAMYAEGDLPQVYQAALKTAASAGRLLTLKSLTGNFPTDAQQSLVGYAESYSMVKYLLAQYGRDKMSALLAIFHEGSTPEDAFRGAYNQELAKLEEAWRASIGAPLPAASATSVPAPTATIAPPPAGTAEPAPSAAAESSPALAAEPTVQPGSTAPSAGRSCFGGLLSIVGAIGGLLFAATRVRGL